MTNQSNAAHAANKEIREAFELSYAMDADDPASATELSHFTNGWRACIMSQVGKPVVMKLAVDATAVIEFINEVARLRSRVADPTTTPGAWWRTVPNLHERRRAWNARQARTAHASSTDTAKEKADKILRERMAPVSEALGLDVMLASAGNGVIQIFTFEGGPLVYTIRADGTAIQRVSWNQPDAPDTLTVDQVKIIPQVAAEIQPAPQPASAPVAKPKRAPLDDWRVQAIAECLETEWDDMTPASAEADARLIVGYLIAHEKESDQIEARHAAEPVDPVVQAVRNLRASAPVAGEAVGKVVLFGDDLKEVSWTAGKMPPPGTTLYAAPQASAEAFDFAAHLARQAEFSVLTFGPGARVAGVCDHIRKELIEVETSGGDLKEWVDVIILGLDGAWRSGATPQEIIAAIVAKQAKNEARTWPDWRTVDPNKAIEHQRNAASCSCPGAGDGSLRHPCAVHPPADLASEKPAHDERQAWAEDMVAAGASDLGDGCWEWDEDDFEFHLWQVAIRRTRRNTLLSVLGRLNSNPYNLMKYECVDLIREMFNKANEALHQARSAQPIKKGGNHG